MKAITVKYVLFLQFNKYHMFAHITNLTYIYIVLDTIFLVNISLNGCIVFQRVNIPKYSGSCAPWKVFVFRC